MAGLQWVRLDTAFPTNPKILTLAAERKWQAIVCYTASIAYAGAQGSDGFIPSYALPFIHGTTKIAQDLIDVRGPGSNVGLWIALPDRNGYEIHNYDEYQEASESTDMRSMKARNAANVRWEKERAARDADGRAKTNGRLRSAT